MGNTVINAAQLYYKENIEGEPLDSDIPIDCFVAGAEFIIKAKRNRNNREIPQDNSFKKINIMAMLEKDDPHKGMIKVSGFYITTVGDSSVGIIPATWELKNEFYFNTPQDLEDFRKEVKELFAWYSGETPIVITFEEHQAELDVEMVEIYKQHPVRYLIKSDDYNDMYMRPEPLTGMYSGDVGECIHLELPHWYSEDNKDVIPSTSDEYWDIIKKALHDKQRTADVNGHHYHSAKRSIKNLLQELNYGNHL